MREKCGLYCTRQLVGVNRNEHATLSPQRGLKMLAENRKAGYVPVLSGDCGGGSKQYVGQPPSSLKSLENLP